MLRLIAGAMVVIVVLAVVLFVAVEPLRWRALVVMRFVNGEVTDVKLGELLTMLRPGSGIWLQPVLEGRSLFAVVESPFRSDGDVTTGAGIFRQRCAACHGTDAGGTSGPSLRKRATLRHGSSDWALYRNIMHGVSGTGMAPAGLAADDTWRVVSFLKSLQRSEGPAVATPKDTANTLARLEGLTYRHLLEADREGSDWRMYSRTYNGWRFSPLTQITTRNVDKLRLRWIRQLTTPETKVAPTPLVLNGVMFITEPPGTVLALDARNGETLWSAQREVSGRLSLCCGKVNRGVAALDDAVYFGTLDAHLVALEARTGRVLWDVELAKAKDGYSITGAPLAVKDMVISGVSGGEYGIRGFLQAFEARTGKTRWRFDTIPGPGEKGHDTWSESAWRTGGGPTVMTGSFDPDLNLVYWGVGNPSPVYEGHLRPGDNLFTNSVIALDATTGRLAWHFQFTPHDAHDWDSNQVPVLATIDRNNVRVPVVAWGNRNGFYYVLDRRDGTFITGVPFVRQNWAERLDGSGRPVLTPAAEVSPGGTLTYPGIGGGTNWQSPAFNPKLGLFFVHATEDGSSIFTRAGKGEVKRRPFEFFVASGSQSHSDPDSVVRALKVATGERVWQYRSSKVKRAWWSGLLATDGGLVFGGAGERAFALDAATGDELWSVTAGATIWQAPITYSVDGQQILVYVAGRAVIAFSLGPER